MAYDRAQYLKNLASMGAYITPAPASPSKTGSGAAVPGSSAYASGYASVIGAARNIQPTPQVKQYNTPTNNNPTPANYSPQGYAGVVASAHSGQYAAPQTPQITPKQITYGQNVSGFNAAEDAQRQLAENGVAWNTATTKEERAVLHAKNMEIGTKAGGMYDPRTGKWNIPQAQPQPQPQPMDQAAPVTQGIPDAVYTPRTSTELQQSAGDQNAIERAALDTAVRERLTSLRNDAQYSNKLLQDNRTLEDWNMSNTLNPFSGRTSYDKGMVNRGRGIDDSARASQLQNTLGATQEELYNFDKLAPERQRQIYNELLKNERDFGLNVADRTGNLGSQRTLGGLASDRAGQQQDWNMSPSNPNNQGQILQNEISQLKLTNLPHELKLGLQDLENQVKSGAVSLETARYQLDEMKNPNSTTNRAKALELHMKELESTYMPKEQKLKLSELQKRISNIGAQKAVTPEAARLKQIQLEKAEIELQHLKDGPAAKLSGKDSTDNYNEAVGNIQSHGLDKPKAKAYVQNPQIRDQLSDSDYKAALKWIDDNL